MASSIPPDVKKIKWAIMPMAAFIFVSAGALATLAIIIEHGFYNVSWLLLLKILGLFMIPYSLLATLIMRWVLWAGFSSDGIYGHSIWGRRRFIGWKDILRVRRFTLGNLPWIRIYSAMDGKVTWLPLFQSRPIEFREEIQKFAPLDNPIRSHIK